MDEFEKIKARAEASTPGPFSIKQAKPSGDFAILDGRRIVAECYFQVGTSSFRPSEENAEFFAHARRDVLWLLEVIERLQTEKNELKKEISRMKGRTVS